MLTAALVAAAFVAGLTGAWSPCGFSMVETVGAAARRGVLAASMATFALAALAGGVLTFGGLGALGALLPGGRRELLLAAAALAVVAAIGEASGVRVVPQIRRQVPEPWRRRLPLPLAAAGYGLLLGLGFATFVLTLAFWVLAAISVALGDPMLGAAIGLAFGAGRALPIVLLAPLSRRALGRAVTDVMAMRPKVLRGFRLADAVALVACAAALVPMGAASAAATRSSAATTVIAVGASDPSVAAGAVAWDAGGRGFLLVPRPAEPPLVHHLGRVAAPLPGSDPALGGSLLAWREGAKVRVVAASDFAPVADVTVPGVDALAVNDGWLVYRARRAGRDRIAARRLPAGAERVLARAGPVALLGRPALSGNLLVFHVASPRENRIVGADLEAGRARVLRRSRSDQLTNPSLRSGELLYVRGTALAQELVLGPLERAAADRMVYRMGPAGVRDAGYQPGYSHVTRTPRPRPAPSLLWTTALGADTAYVTLLPARRGAERPRIVRIPR